MILPEQAGSWDKGADRPRAWVAACRAATQEGYAMHLNDLVLLDLVEQPVFEEFLTLPAYDRILADEKQAA